MKAALFLPLLLPLAATALDLTPKQSFKDLEGHKIPVLQFKHESRRAQWMPPADWRMNSDGQRLSFFVRTLTHAGMELHVIPRPAGADPLQADETAVKFAAAFLPRSATEVKVSGRNPGPYTINGIPAREVLMDFQEPGHPTKASLSVVDLNEKECLVVVISAQPRDFGDVRSTAIESLNTWQIL